MSRIATVVGQPRHAEPAEAAQAAEIVGIPISSIEDAAYRFHHSGSSAAGIAVIGAANGLDGGRTALRLARALAADGRVVLVGLDSKDDAIASASGDPFASGLSELAGGTASFRDIINKDRQSSLHLIACGRASNDQLAVLSAPAMATYFDALARSYDYVVVDAGAIGRAALDAIAVIAPHAVLFAGTLPNAVMASARERLLAAGFDDVMVLVGTWPSRVTETAAAA
jgi:Mrp family chromosome partitioning ATPase